MRRIADALSVEKSADLEGEKSRDLAGHFHRCGNVIRMAKLRKAEKRVQEQMLALLEWAADRRKSWRTPRSDGNPRARVYVI